MAASVTSPMTTTNANALRQPKNWPSHDASGTPITVATVSPVITCATALARWSGPNSWAATSAATPKKAPCGRPARKRAPIRTRIVRGQHGGHVADGEQRHQAHQHDLAVELGGHRGDDRRADHHAECVGGDDVARGRLGDVQSAGDLGQQTHRDELVGADAESAQRQGQDAQPCPAWAQRGRRRRRGGPGSDGHRRYRLSVRWRLAAAVQRSIPVPTLARLRPRFQLTYVYKEQK